MDLRYYFSLLKRRVHWFLLMVILCTTLGVTVAQLLPTTYEAEALLVVESEQIPDELAASTVQTHATEQLQIIRQRVLAREVLLELANRFDLYEDRNSPLTADEMVSDLRSRINISFGGSSRRRRGVRQATLVRVSFQGSSARGVALVSNEMVTLILNEDVSMRTTVARQTLEFFEREVSRLDQELAQKSATLLEFKENNLTALPDSLNFRRSQQARAQERLLQVEREISALRDRRERLAELRGTDQPLAQLPEERLSQEQVELRKLIDDRTRLLAILAPQNPKVKLLDTRIAALEALVTNQLSSQGGAVIDEGGSPLTAFDLQLADIDVQLENLQQQKDQIETSLQNVTASIEVTPGNTIALETLERDFASLRQQYDQAVRNRAKAVTGDTIEALSKGQRISVIEQATVPQRPISPNRPIIAAGGLGLGLIIGLGLVVLIELIKGGVRRPVDLTKGLGITTFAALPYMRTRQEIIRRRLVIAGGMLSVVGCSAGGLWLVNQYYAPIETIFEAVVLRFG